jgi:hypothetical protein
VGEHGLKQRERGGGVVAKELLGVDHGLACFNQGGEVEDGVERAAGLPGAVEKVFKGNTVIEFALNEVDPWG